MSDHDALKKLWADLLPGVEVPSDEQFALWCSWHDIETVRYGIIHAAKKNLKLGGCIGLDRALRFASACMNYRNNPARQREVELRRRIEKAISESEGQTP